MRTVVITCEPMALEDLLAVVGGAGVELGPDVRSRIAASRATVDAVLADGEPVYGLTTQVGHGKDTRLSQEQARGQQQMLVMTHAGGFGPPLPTDQVRAALAVRLNGIARGGSGASPAAAETLAAMLNAGVHPLVPRTSSVGAGDLGPMAGMAQVAIGEGRAEYAGEELSGAEALRRAGIRPLVLESKDGLALISANGVSIGAAALLVARAARTAAAADRSAALSMEATGANPSITVPIVAAAKPFPGQIAAAEHLREELAGSALLKPGAAGSVQDPLSFRVAPQVHGALREYVAFARRAVEIELNSASDNPLVSVETQTLVSNGNFHPIVMAIAFDALRVAIAHVGQLSERRMSHLWDAFMARVAAAPAPPSAVSAPPPSAASGPPALFGLSLRYPAAAAYAELRQLAAPVTLDVPPLDIGVEDHATGAPLSVSKTGAALDLLDDLLAIELLLARDVLWAAPASHRLGAGASEALKWVEKAITEAAHPRPDAVHRALRARFPGSG
jgi:histidine ammonia-lyase